MEENPNPEKRNDWLAHKIKSQAPAQYDYPFAERAEEVHSHWMVGYDELEIAAFMGLSEIDVAQDLQYMQKRMTPRQVLAQCNDRERIKLYRTRSKAYNRLLGESLEKTADEYLAAGFTPVPVLKEYRQAINMEEKPGGLNIAITKNTANFVNPNGNVHPANLGNGGIRSYEDLVRMIIKSDPTCALQPVIDADVQEVQPPDDDSEDLPEEEDEATE